jgi:hypothetical protein
MHSTPSPEQAQFLTKHGDFTTWSSADIEAYEHLTECADPAYTYAATEDVRILGRHRDDNGHLVVDFAAPADTVLLDGHHRRGTYFTVDFLAGLTSAA